MCSFVPADSARIGITDKIFTRVGASDNISLTPLEALNKLNDIKRIVKG